IIGGDNRRECQSKSSYAGLNVIQIKPQPRAGTRQKGMGLNERPWIFLSDIVSLTLKCQQQ
ncbi:MAG: hypothetical protein VX668_10770, partial [Planctomycetota bacterium]|nr:hypothetical protein [Planctomycetota bacterium]